MVRSPYWKHFTEKASNFETSEINCTNSESNVLSFRDFILLVYKFITPYTSFIE